MKRIAAINSAARFQLRVQPRAARDRIVGWHGETLRIQVHAPPVEGAANAAVTHLLASALGVPRRSVRVLHGTTGRDKLVEVDGLEPGECRIRLAAALSAPR